MTWGEFKAWVESNGVTDKTPLLWITLDEEDTQPIVSIRGEAIVITGSSVLAVGDDE